MATTTDVTVTPCVVTKTTSKTVWEL